MVLDQEARNESERLRLYRHVEIIAEALPGFRAVGLRAGLSRAENAEAHGA